MAGLTMSVNVSARQLQDPEFGRDVEQVLADSRLDPRCLVLEVTESALVMDMVRIAGVMESIRELGVHIALDDFGTGYSSLLYLKGLPIDRLKVDRSFVSGLGSTGQDPTIITTVVDLAHKLGLCVVAEGVETEAELRAVGDMGCDEVQGFLLGRPAPPDTFVAEAPGPVRHLSDPDRRAVSGLGGDGLLGVHHVGHHHPDELVGLVGHPAGHPAVDGPGLRGVAGVRLGVGHRLGQVGGEGLGHAGLGLGPGHRHVQGVGVLLAVEPPAPSPA